MKDKYFLPKMLVLIAAVWMTYDNYLKKPSFPDQEPAPQSSYFLPAQGGGSNLQTSPPGLSSVTGQAKNDSAILSGGFSQNTEAQHTQEKQMSRGEERVSFADAAPKVDVAAIREELGYLSANRPDIMIGCPRCGGQGELPVPCETCGGRGSMPIPGVTAFTANVPCSDCLGSGYQRCPDCTFGLIANADYEAQKAAWTAQRHELWGQLGYTAEDIRQMEIEEAKVYLDAADSYNTYGGGYGEETVEVEVPPGLCRICYGTGDCATCNGDGFYQNPLTGNQISCPNCRYTQGKCWSCGGSGYGT